MFLFKQLTDSWSAYVKPSPRKILAKPVEEKPIEQQKNEDNVDAGLFRGITSGLGGWIFNSLEDTTEPSQVGQTNRDKRTITNDYFL